MQNQKQMTARQTFKKYAEPIVVEGSAAELSVITEQVILDIDGKEVIIDRKEEPIFGQTKTGLLKSMNEAMSKLKAEQAAAIDRLQAQIDEVEAL